MNRLDLSMVTDGSTYIKSEWYTTSVKEKDKNHMLNLINTKGFDTIQYPLMIKKKYSHQSKYRGNIPQHNRSQGLHKPKPT